MTFLGFGNGQDGIYTPVSGTFNPGMASLIGTIGSRAGISGTIQSWTPGTLVLIYQTTGSGAGNYEFNQIESISGTNITFVRPLTNTYACSGYDRAQIMKVPQYAQVNINAGVVLSGVPWNGVYGGLICFVCNGQVTVAGKISANVAGYRGGPHSDETSKATGKRGEGYHGYWAYNVDNGGHNDTGIYPLDNGGGGAWNNNADAGSGGGGGSYSSQGTYGAMGHPTNGSGPGVGGDPVGSDTLATFYFGGGGGGGSNSYTGGPANYGGAGATGGGGVFILANRIVVTSTGAITADADNGYSAMTHAAGSGGGGAGGFVFLKGGTINIQAVLNYTYTAEYARTTRVTNTGITALGGVGGTSGGFNIYGGTGGSGRIRMEGCIILGNPSDPASSKLQGGFTFCGALASVLE